MFLVGHVHVGHHGNKATIIHYLRASATKGVLLYELVVIHSIIYPTHRWYMYIMTLRFMPTNMFGVWGSRDRGPLH